MANLCGSGTGKMGGRKACWTHALDLEITGTGEECPRCREANTETAIYGMVAVRSKFPWLKHRYTAMLPKGTKARLCVEWKHRRAPYRVLISFDHLSGVLVWATIPREETEDPGFMFEVDWGQALAQAEAL
jgi:hypothetical protein